MKHLLVAAALAAVASPAIAHVSLNATSAPAGSYFFGEFRIAHGCAGSDTISIKVEIPDAILVAKPQPKTGWSLETESKPIDKPIQVDGRPVESRISSITWRGDLEDTEWDQLGLMAKLPSTPGVLVFPVTQTCAQGEVTWDEVPTAANPHPAHPAPTLTVSPPAGDDMAGMDMSGR
jgi:uncharacterized protein YcnI